VACLPAYFLGNQGGSNAMLLPEMLFFTFCPSMQYFNHKSARGVKFQGKVFA
jgi:hypothetical protein